MDLRPIPIGFHTVKICDFESTFFFEVPGSNSIVLILLIRIFSSDQKQKSRNCIKFAHAIFSFSLSIAAEKKGLQTV